MQSPCRQPSQHPAQEALLSQQVHPVRSSPSSSLLPSDEQSARAEELPSSPPPISSSSAEDDDTGLRAAAGRSPCLFAFPLESNFSGARYEPAVVNEIQTSGLSILRHAKEEDEEKTQIKPQLDAETLSVTDQQLSPKQQHLLGEAQEALQTPREDQQSLKEEEQWQGHRIGAEEEEACQSGQPDQEGVVQRLHSRRSQPSGARWHVLIDAAKACTTAPPDLTKHPADFVVSLE